MFLINEIKKAFNGDAWHGNHVMHILSAVNPESAFEHFIPNAHAIAEIALHLTSWTEEVTARLMGKSASEPVAGDWPMPNGKESKNWEKIIFDFKIANDELIRICEAIEDDQWDQKSTDVNPLLNTNITKAELLNGLIQHHAYHAGQIALLSKF
ncbi:DinB family protein [Pedobacter mucosus]|uniref:DinB family protein n=1 Tax=Pedobacter mucosus TaxID=2895286 RepID=UPI001EE3D0AF|nr:DinB family protein [Pedobacter mucosus]UKT64186.1 DinB family protein [Pedobacter mucosus]